NESSQSLTITVVSSPVGGSVSISGTNVIFNPALNYNGLATFVYTVRDDGTTNGVADWKTATATASFTITPVNDAPTSTITIRSYNATEQVPLALHGTGMRVDDVDA